MARNVYYNPRSPLILGQDPGDILGKAFGVAFTSFVNDKLVAPIALRFIPINGGEMLSKLVDAGTTVLSAWVGGQAIGIIDRSVGKDVEFGGLILAGGLLLLWVSWKMWRELHPARGADTPDDPSDDDVSGLRPAKSFAAAAWAVAVADVSMSLDNVLAISAAAQGDLFLVAFGIGLSLPLVIWGSGVLATLMERFVWLVWLGGGILGYVAGEMVLRDPIVLERLGQGLADALHYPLPLSLGSGIMALGWWFGRRHAATRIAENP